MLISKICGWGAVAVWTALIVTCGSAFAEDIGVAPITPPRGSNVRAAPKKKVGRPKPTVPRPIQDETTPAASTPVSVPVQAKAPVAAPAARPRRGAEEAVNLDALTPSRPAPAPVAAPSTASGKSNSSYASGGMSPHGSTASGILPNFKFYFDFMVKSWKGGSESDFEFDSYHERLMVEFTPTPDLMFQADLLDKKYFETDYMLTPRLQVRWGRIWIPFDDMSPHSMFGGRINTSEFRQGNETAFLPDIWADLGMGIKYTLADSAGYSSELHFYVVNGFHESRGTSPVQGEQNGGSPAGTNAAYPDFTGTSGTAGDNNNAKAFGARWHSVFGRRFGLGLSVYKDDYGNKDEGKFGILMLGIDAQLRPTNTTEIRAGYVTMKVDLDQGASGKGSFMRGGTYIELGQKFGQDDRWKFLLRAGSSQNDNRVVDVSDKSIVGATLLKNFGSVETQLNYFHDLHQVPGKIAYDYGEFRIVTMF
jgi:hypothetical protein